MALVKLLVSTPEGGPGDVRNVSRSRARDLVNAGLAQRPADQPKRPRKK